jgi:hypothetical protein
VIYPCTGISLPAGCTVIYPTVPTTPPPPSVPVVNGVPVTFSPGYNMVGGPTGTDLSQAAVAYSFANGQYSSGSKSVTACQGYFAYFTTSTVIGLPGTSTGPTQTCHLAAGWNLLGNPFSGTATLPAGTIGYYWSPSTGSYSQVSVIPQGGAVFVYSDTVRDVTLTYGAVAGHSTSVVTITDSTIGPVTVHVGDQIQVIFTHPNAEVVSFDSLYFKGIAGGTTYPSTCYNPNFCVVSVSSLSWTGQAQVAGTTSLTFSPVCYSNSPSGCLFNPHAVQVNIQP